VSHNLHCNTRNTYVLWNVYLPNAVHSVCLNRLSCTEVGIYNGANTVLMVFSELELMFMFAMSVCRLSSVEKIFNRSRDMDGVPKF